ncbi:class F sortase [Geodermatophilus sp. DSM 45219]|uniref:class F sortase n=1 Tax=Geodermatophilus sp. DSM 45219 TaxID=1881103 RepID=UPI0008843F74|nr:class F sortase [Geodermatophilus sp. DSM 45219]SDO46192.1 Sortase family protein [Geodermatophilus sp. DSM 45219]
MPGTGTLAIRLRGEADGEVRIVGAYPPPLDDVAALLARPPRVTRYGRHRRRTPRAVLVWSAASVVLAAAGTGVLMVGPAPEPAVHRVVAAPADLPLEQPARAAAAAMTPAAVVHQLPASPPTAVRIPALRVTSAVMELGLRRDGSMEVPPAGYPVGWYDGSPTPGQLGPAVLAGHVDWEGEPGAFAGLDELVPGDTVEVDRADGSTAVFVVDRVEEHAKDAFPSDAVYGDLDHAGLRLITCGGAFDEDTGDYTENVVVFARLTG